MSRLLIVPAKPLERAKQRLAPAFSPSRRRELVLAMLSDVTSVAAALGTTWVLCSDPEAASVAAACGATAVEDETPLAGLNPSLERALRRAVAERYASVLIVASDVPCVRADDLRAVAEAATGSARAVVVAPSDDGSGTNVLCLAPADVIAPAFGPDSRAAHESAAKAAGIEAAIVHRPTLALDVDGAEDLRRALELGVGPGTAAFLAGAEW